MKTKTIGQKITAFSRSLGSKLYGGVRTLGQKIYDNHYKLLAGAVAVAGAGIAAATGADAIAKF